MYGIFTYIYHKNQPNVGKSEPNHPSIQGFFKVVSLFYGYDVYDLKTPPNFFEGVTLKTRCLPWNPWGAIFFW